MQTYPNIKPNFIKPLELPEYKVSETEWKSGFSNVKRESYQGIGTQITLEYQHLEHTDLVTLINFYNTVKGVSTGFNLPTNFIQFPDLAIEAISLLESTTVWKFSTEPNFSLLVASPEIGRYNGSVQLRSVSNDITEPITVSTPSNTIYSVIAEPVPDTPPTNDQDVEIVDGSGVISTNPNPVEDTTQENTRLTRSETTLRITETINPGSNLSKSVDLSASLMLIKVSCTKKIRLRIYLSSNARTTDLNRVVGFINYNNHGLLFESVFTDSITEILTTPNTFLYNSDNTNKTFLLTITNLDNANVSNFDIVFTYIPIEV